MLSNVTYPFKQMAPSQMEREIHFKNLLKFLNDKFSQRWLSGIPWHRNNCVWIIRSFPRWKERKINSIYLGDLEAYLLNIIALKWSKKIFSLLIWAKENAGFDELSMCFLPIEVGAIQWAHKHHITLQNCKIEIITYSRAGQKQSKLMQNATRMAKGYQISDMVFTCFLFIHKETS